LRDEWEFDGEDEDVVREEEIESIADDGADVTGIEMQRMVRDNWLEFISRVH
jgi:hypothetical protein